MRRLLLPVACAAFAVTALVTSDPTLLTALPVLALFALLGAGRYVGESRAVARLRRRRPPVRRRPAAAIGAQRLWDVACPRGGELLARRMGRRGPPSVVLAA